MSVEVTPQKPLSERCKACNQTLRPGEIVCPACGIPTTSTGKTHKIDVTHDVNTEKGWSIETRHLLDVTIIFEVGEQAVILPKKDKLIIGRAGEDYTPDLDLTPFGAGEKGVSRQHVQITRDILIYLTDLNSTNGTFLNGQKLRPNTEYMLSDGDELHVGYLKFHVRFQW